MVLVPQFEHQPLVYSEYSMLEVGSSVCYRRLLTSSMACKQAIRREVRNEFHWQIDQMSADEQQLLADFLFKSDRELDVQVSRQISHGVIDKLWSGARRRRNQVVLSGEDVPQSIFIQRETYNPGSPDHPRPENQHSFAGLGPYPVNGIQNLYMPQRQDPQPQLSASSSPLIDNIEDMHESSPTHNAADIDTSRLYPPVSDPLEVASNATSFDSQGITGGDSGHAVAVQEQCVVMHGALWLVLPLLLLIYLLRRLFVQVIRN